MVSKKAANSPDTGGLPFGAGAVDGLSSSSPESGAEAAPKKRRPRRRRRSEESPEGEEAAPQQEASARPKREPRAATEQSEARAPKPDAAESSGEPQARQNSEEARPESARQAKRRRWQERRKGRRGRRAPQGEGTEGQPSEGTAPATQERPRGRSQGQGQERNQERSQERGRGGRGQGRGPKRTQDGAAGAASAAKPVTETEGLLVLEKGNHGQLRLLANDYIPSNKDVYVSPRLVQKYRLVDGSIIKGGVRAGQGKRKLELIDVESVDGMPKNELKHFPAFKSLTSIDPDFHYAVGDGSGEVSLKVLDLLCPVGRGQRGLIVAPPRSGKTVLLQQFAKAIEKIYPEVHLMVMLVDERPEEATDWKRTIGEDKVFVSTNDEMPKKHVELAESMWRRCKRMVELGQDVVLLLDSITRLGRAYNNVKGDSGRTMSGGLDTRALERPKQFFGAARNTETAGSLTILGTTLIDTGSRMDQVIFEEFKGTGNMELVLNRRLADRRIFPAMDVIKSGTRKEEKLHSKKRLRRVGILRRVLTRMHFAEAMELLVTKLDEVELIDDFLSRFDIDPEA